MTIHWCGTGLSAVPGLRRLIDAGHKVTVWNRTVDKAREAVGDIASDIRAYGIGALDAAIRKGDLVVSMLPADQHVAIAALCLNKGHISCRRPTSRPRCGRWTNRPAMRAWRW